MADHAANESGGTGAQSKLRRRVDRQRDHIRGGSAASGVVTVVVYADYLCPYCRRLRIVLAQLRELFGERLAYVFRHFPNEVAHPGATLIAQVAEAAGQQGRFWEMHDWLFSQPLPLRRDQIKAFAGSLGIDLERFERDIEAGQTRQRVEEDAADGRRNGVTGTPTFFVDGVRYDGAWDFYSMLETLQLPVAARVQRSARSFANLPASGGLVLLLAALAALICANTPLAPLYQDFIAAQFTIGPPAGGVTLSVSEWLSEGLLSIFFLLVGLEIRREITRGDLSEPRKAFLPVVAAVGGTIVPAAIYLALNGGASARGWAVPTTTDIAFALGLLAVLGPRVPTSLRVFVAALAVTDDVIGVLTLALFYSEGVAPAWILAAAAAVLVLFALNRGRVYATWPYVVVAAALWFSLHSTGIHGALAGVLLAAFVPTRPPPSVGPLLAQAATALSTLENAEREEGPTGATATAITQQPVWDWASRNLSAASERLSSPADRVERAVAPWSTYLILPLFAFSASGISFELDLSAPDAWRIFAGVVLGLAIGKALGVSLASFLAVRSGAGQLAPDITLRNFIGAAFLCGVGDTVALLLVDQAFTDRADIAIAKAAVFTGSAIAAVVGVTIIATNPQPVARTEAGAA